MYWGTAWQESTSQPGLLCQTSCGRVVLRPMCRIVCVAPPINAKVSSRMLSASPFQEC